MSKSRATNLLCRRPKEKYQNGWYDPEDKNTHRWETMKNELEKAVKTAHPKAQMK
jgi:hypothetical protein